MAKCINITYIQKHKLKFFSVNKWSKVTVPDLCKNLRAIVLSIDSDEKKDNDSIEDEYYENMSQHDQEEMIKKMVEDDHKNRDYWDEEYKSMNKWARYGIAWNIDIRNCNQ